MPGYFGPVGMFGEGIVDCIAPLLVAILPNQFPDFRRDPESLPAIKAPRKPLSFANQFLDPGVLRRLLPGCRFWHGPGDFREHLVQLGNAVGGLALMAASARFPKSPGLASSLFPGCGPPFLFPYVGGVGEREPYRPVVAVHIPAEVSSPGSMLPF